MEPGCDGLRPVRREALEIRPQPGPLCGAEHQEHRQCSACANHQREGEGRGCLHDGPERWRMLDNRTRGFILG